MYHHEIDIVMLGNDNSIIDMLYGAPRQVFWHCYLPSNIYIANYCRMYIFCDIRPITLGFTSTNFASIIEWTVDWQLQKFLWQIRILSPPLISTTNYFQDYSIRIENISICLQHWKILWDLLPHPVPGAGRAEARGLPRARPGLQVIRTRHRWHILTSANNFSTIYNLPKFMEITPEGVLNVNFSHNILYNKVTWFDISLKRITGCLWYRCTSSTPSCWWRSWSPGCCFASSTSEYTGQSEPTGVQCQVEMLIITRCCAGEVWPGSL